MNKELTIIVPVYNEEKNLNRVENKLKAYMNSSQIPILILFVNDGSTDKSQKLIESICNRNTRFNFLTLDKNYGLSTAIKVGFDNIKTSLTGYIDSDLQTSPFDFDLLLDFIDDFDMVTGIRLNRKDSFVKSASSDIANVIRKIFTRDGIKDTGCPLKIIRTEYAQRIPMFNGLHRFLPAMVLLQKGKVKQVPVRHFPRIAGKANYGILNRIIGSLMDCFAFLWIKNRYINYNISNQG